MYMEISFLSFAACFSSFSVSGGLCLPFTAGAIIARVWLACLKETKLSFIT